MSAVNLAQAAETIEGWIARGERRYVCVTGMHGVMECQADPDLRRIHNRAGMVTPDGMPMVWLSRLYGRRSVSRVYGPDLLLEMCQRSLQAGYSHYFYGGAAGIPERLAERLQQRFPDLQVAGTYSPPFRSLTVQEDAQIVERINASGAAILWVGLSTPRQERWMAEHLGRIAVPVMVGVGAAFDFHAGAKRQAPRWMQRSGLEWLFRLATEPKRLWRRYLTNIPRFLWLVILQTLKIKQFSLEE
ncbi:MAG TPA: WecB/TagA/CpsF family glycosyltransferase [Anaerolineaceae bacterium]